MARSTWGPLFPSNGQSTDPDGETVSYEIVICTNPDFSECDLIQVVSTLRRESLVALAYGTGLLFLGTVIAGGVRSRGRSLLLFGAVNLTGLLGGSCGDVTNGGGGNEMRYTVSGLDPATVYS